MSVLGRFSLWVDHRVLIGTASGSWCVETAREFADEFKQIAGELIAQPWGHIIYLDDWGLGVPEIEPVIEELTHWAIANNLCLAAQVFSPNMLKAYQMNKMVHDVHGHFERRQFANADQAFSWLHQHGFSTGHSDFKRHGT